ncbi:MAG: hypothetical protein EON93_17870, partial [Burkholderiales bacterium]
MQRGGAKVFSAGIRNPGLSFLICVVITLAALGSIAFGVIEMQMAGRETLGSGLKIGLAILPAIIGPLMAWNFWWGTKVFASIQRGENVIGRWTVTAAEVAEFADIDKVGSAQGSAVPNEWSPSRETPPSGIEVIFAKDAVLVGDTYFALSITGPFRFTSVRMLSGRQQTIAFETLLTLANRFGARTTAGELRIPVSRAACADAGRVVTHFSCVAAREIAANPDFYRSRIRFGMLAAPVCFAVAALGFVLRSILGGSE